MTGTETFSNIDPRLLIVAGAAFAIFFLVLTVATAGTRSRALSRRLKTIGGRERAGTVAVGAGGKRASGPIEFMRQILNRFDLMRADKVRAIAMFLAGAGWRSKSATVLYLFAKLTLPLALGAASATLFYWVAPLLVKGNLRLPLVIFVVLIASQLPDILVRRVAEARRERIRLALPDALDLMVICAEAGLSLDATIERVAKEIEGPAPDLAEEFHLLSLELRYVGDRRLGFDTMARRIDLPAIQALSATLVQTERFGTPIAQSLRVLATEQRNNRMMKAEEKAAKLPATMTIPMILFILPAVFVVLLGPAILNIMDAVKNM
ncbi:MAG: type II secretion system F family protein [Rhodospirillaceae bacterium]|nr:type II secretion system F family protein [Rhodospirillaceae bacterium]